MTRSCIVAFILFGVATQFLNARMDAENVNSNRGSGTLLVLRVRSQVVSGDPEQAGLSRPEEQVIEIDPAKSAIVTVDVWNGHSSTEHTRRIDSIVPRLNEAVEAARNLGMVIIHGPSIGALKQNARELYPGERLKHNIYTRAPQRKATLALRDFPLPELDESWKEHGEMPFAEHERVVDGTWVTETSPKWRMHPELVLGEDDYIVDNLQELWNVCQTHGIGNLIYCGFASNMCLVSKPWGIGGGKSLGINCYFIRDLVTPLTPMDENLSVRTDRPLETADFVHEEVVRHIETYLAPSLDSRQLIDSAGHFR